jgi:DNA-binding response OmpR family regulator
VPRLSRILIIEDELEISELYRFGLEVQGFEVQVAATGEEGLATALTGWPDCVLLDVHLPDVDGFTVIDRLRAADPSMSSNVIVFTNDNDPAMMRRAFELGVVDYLQKVRLTPAGVALRINAWLESSHSKDVA